jgi:hypothetical protein
MLGTRNGKQIRDRFINVLDSEIKKGKFTEEEDRKLIILFNQNGPKWATIAKYYPNRTADMIKNRFHSSIKKKFTQENTEKCIKLKECNQELSIFRDNYTADTSYLSVINPINTNNFSIPTFTKSVEIANTEMFMMIDNENMNYNSTISSRVCESDIYSSNNFTYDFASHFEETKQETYYNNENIFNLNLEEYFSI